MAYRSTDTLLNHFSDMELGKVDGDAPETTFNHDSTGEERDDPTPHSLETSSSLSAAVREIVMSTALPESTFRPMLSLTPPPPPPSPSPSLRDFIVFGSFDLDTEPGLPMFRSIDDMKHDLAGFQEPPIAPIAPSETNVDTSGSSSFQRSMADRTLSSSSNVTSLNSSSSQGSVYTATPCLPCISSFNTEFNSDWSLNEEQEGYESMSFDIVSQESLSWEEDGHRQHIQAGSPKTYYLFSSNVEQTRH